MRRIGAGLVAWLLVLLAVASAAMAESRMSEEALIASGIDPSVYRTNYSCFSGALNAICAEGDDVYVLSGGELWSADAALERGEKLHAFEEELCGFAVSEGVFYFSYLEEGEVRFARLSPEGETDNLFSLPADRPMFRMVVSDEAFVVLWERVGDEFLSDGMDSVHLCIVKAYDFDGRERPQDVGFATDVAVVPGRGVAWATDEDSAEWIQYHVLDVQSGRSTPEIFGASVSSLAMSPDGGTFVSCDGYRICQMAGQGRGYFENEVGYCGMNGWADCALACTKERIIHYRLHGDLCAQALDITGRRESEDQLIVANAYGFEETPQGQAALKQFRQLHPEADVTFRNLPEEQLRTALLANDGSVDLFALSTQDAMAYVDAGAVVNLDEWPELRGQQEALVGGGLFCWDGVRYGAAYDSVFVDCLKANASLAAYAPELDWADCTWAEVLDAAEQFRTDTDGDGRPDVYFLCDSYRFPAWYAQYVVSCADPKQLNFDTALFRATAEQYKRCIQAGAILEAGDDVDPELALYRADKLYGLKGDDFLPLPALGESSAPPAQATALAISWGAKHPDWAADFLRCVASEEAQREQPFDVGLLRDSSIYPACSDMTEAERQNLEAQKAYFDRAKPEWAHLEYNLYAGDQFEKYFADEITLDELVSGLQQKLQMVLWG